MADIIARGLAAHITYDKLETTNTPLNGYGLRYNNGNLEWENPTRSLNYVGIWDANTNNPEIVSGIGILGDFYKVSVAGNTLIDGEDQWEIDDSILFNGTIWQKIPARIIVNPPVYLNIDTTITTLDTVYFIDTSIVDITITIPDSISNNGGRELILIKNTGNYNVIVKTTSNQNINSNTTQTISKIDTGINIVSNGNSSGWKIIQDSRILTSHNELLNQQGGNNAERYHLTLSQYNNVFYKNVDDTDDITEGNNKFVSTTEKTAITHSNRSNLDSINQNLGTSNSSSFTGITNNGFVKNIQTTLTSGTYSINDGYYKIRCDCSTGNIILNLPTGVGVKCIEFVVKKIDSTTNTVTINPYGSELIDTFSYIVIANQGDSYTLSSNGNGFDII